jgi:CHAD domain-containing protein
MRMPLTTTYKIARRKTVGLGYWMVRVLEECENVAADFGPDPVHDLRVSLRRCRSLADGLMALDPDPEWKAMKKAGKRLFQRLGALRDIHVMAEWVEKLDPARAGQEEAGVVSNIGPEPGPKLEAAGAVAEPAVADVAETLRKILKDLEQDQKCEAEAALEEFDRKQWKQWSKSLPARAARFRLGSALFKHLALERWTAARELHNRALRNRSQTALHSLRIGIKRFRYIVENFLPAEHKAWSDDLKEIQDLLGEVHDLDVLWAKAVGSKVFPDAQSRELWHERIRAERGKRIARYREKMVGPASLWNVWRDGLPQGKQIAILALRRMKLWASGLDPDFPHSERVANLALQIYDGLSAAGWQPAVDVTSARCSLLAAALLHDVGKFKRVKGHHKSSLDLIRKHGAPLGWKEADVQRAAVVARFHCGALPGRRHALLRDLLPDEQKATIQLAAILRLANAMDAGHDGRIQKVRLENGGGRDGHPARHEKHTNVFLRKRAGLVANEALIIQAQGYSPAGCSAQTIAAERHLLEIVLRRPVIVKAMKPDAPGQV